MNYCVYLFRIMSVQQFQININVFVRIQLASFYLIPLACYIITYSHTGGSILFLFFFFTPK